MQMVARWSLRFLSVRDVGGAVGVMTIALSGFSEICTDTLESADGKCGDEDDVSYGYAG